MSEKLPKCFGRYSEDKLGNTSVECDYCGKYDQCLDETIRQLLSLFFHI